MIKILPFNQDMQQDDSGQNRLASCFCVNAFCERNILGLEGYKAGHQAAVIQHHLGKE